MKTKSVNQHFILIESSDGGDDPRLVGPFKSEAVARQHAVKAGWLNEEEGEVSDGHDWVSVVVPEKPERKS